MADDIFHNNYIPDKSVSQGFNNTTTPKKNPKNPIISYKIIYLLNLYLILINREILIEEWSDIKIHQEKKCKVMFEFPLQRHYSSFCANIMK